MGERAINSGGGGGASVSQARGVRAPGLLRAGVLALGALALTMSAGCRNGDASRAGEHPAGRVTERPLPALDDVVRGYNARIAEADRVWARATLRVDTVDERGKPEFATADAFVQLIRPDRMAVIVTKIGETYFYLGSDAERYWWIDLENKRAVTGLNRYATVEAVRRFGVPVPPLDLMELLGVLPLDGTGAGLSWSPDGRWLVIETARTPGEAAQIIEPVEPTASAQAEPPVADPRYAMSPRHRESGATTGVGANNAAPARPRVITGPSRRVFIDPATFAARRVELRDAGGAAGEVLISSDLDRDVRVHLVESGGEARIPSRAVVRIPAMQTTITMNLDAPENRGSRTPTAAFDLRGLLRRHRVTDVEFVDDAPEPGAGTVSRAEGAR